MSGRPKFANTSADTMPRRPRVDDTAAEVVMGSHEVKPLSIVSFIQEDTSAKEPGRAITLRFEESLWQKVEKHRGRLSKNEFFKKLVLFYDQQALSL